MVKVIGKDGIRLPFMGKDKFIELMRIGLGYDRQRRVFFIKEPGHIDRIKTELEAIIGEEVSIAQNCILCDLEFPCSQCQFQALCPSLDIPAYCICEKCFSQPEIYPRYIKKAAVHLNPK